jgi:hypothetical protein
MTVTAWFRLHRRLRGAGSSGIRCLAALAAAWALGGATPEANAQDMAACRSGLDAAQAQKLRQCEGHGGCRNVLRVIDTCPALKAFVGHLASNGPLVDDGVLRRALVSAGVPGAGLASCTADFNRALCRQFLNIEDVTGASAPVASGGPEQQVQAEWRRLIEQAERARQPADAHRFAELKLAMCAQARSRAERELQCEEAAQAVQACARFSAEWSRRVVATLAEAEKLALEPTVRSLRTLELAPCPQTLPQSNQTPQQALAAAAAETSGGTSPAALPGTPYGTECKSALLKLEEHLETVRRRRPAQPDALAVTQVNLYMLNEQLSVLATLCRGQREFDFHKAMQESYDRSLQSCRENAVDARQCVPKVAW